MRPPRPVRWRHPPATRQTGRSLVIVPGVGVPPEPTVPPRQTRPARAAVLRFHTGFPGRRIRHAFRHPGARTPVPETWVFVPPHGAVTYACRNLAWRNVRAAALLPPRGTSVRPPPSGVAATRSWQRPVSWASHVVAGRRGGPFGLSPFQGLPGLGEGRDGRRTRLRRWVSAPWQAGGTARTGAAASMPGCAPRLRPAPRQPRCCRCARG